MNSAEDAPKVDSIDKTKEELALVEAALYVAGRPLDLKTLGQVIGTRSKKKVQSLARMLMNEYQHRETALEVLELENQRFVLQLKTAYSPRVKKLALRPLLPQGPLKTLAYIAYRQPVLQKQVIDVRGRHAYGHIKQLIDAGLIEAERRGKNRVLRPTEYFADYFGLSHDPKIMKRQLRRIFKDMTSKNSDLPEEHKEQEKGEDI